MLQHLHHPAAGFLSEIIRQRNKQEGENIGLVADHHLFGYGNCWNSLGFPASTYDKSTLMHSNIWRKEQHCRSQNRSGRLLRPCVHWLLEKGPFSRRQILKSTSVKYCRPLHYSAYFRLRKWTSTANGTLGASCTRVTVAPVSVRACLAWSRWYKSAKGTLLHNMK